MTDITRLDYDEMKAQGWDYHRNGVSGLGFYVRYDEDRPEPALLVAFHTWVVDETHEDGGEWLNARPLVLPSRALDLMAKALTETPEVRITNRYTIVGFTEEGKRMIGVFDPDHVEGVAFAVFDLDVLPDVTFGRNSWRGDRYARQLGLL